MELVSKEEECNEVKAKGGGEGNLSIENKN